MVGRVGWQLAGAALSAVLAAGPIVVTCLWLA
jgi:hypothetical protein